MYFITTLRIKNDKLETSRCVGYVETYEEAEQIVTKNEYDICETIYPYAIIENISAGIYEYDLNPTWFKWNNSLEIYEKCEKPDCFKNVVGIAIG